MKILFTALFILYLSTHPAAKPQLECNIRRVSQAVPPILWYEQTMDGEKQQPLVTRFLHNKASIFMSQFTKCYAHSFEPLEVYFSIGIVGLLFWLNFIYKNLVRKNWLPISILLVVPVVSIFINDFRIVDLSYKIFALIGFIYFLKKIK